MRALVSALALLLLTPIARAEQVPCLEWCRQCSAGTGCTTNCLLDNQPMFAMVWCVRMCGRNFRTTVDSRDFDRVTPVGRFLRYSSIEILPQLLNVFRGEMSCVNPRPERPFFLLD